MTSVATSLKSRLPAEITTARLVLVTPNAAHAPAIAQLANNENVHKWMARLPFPYGLSDARLFIDQIVPSDGEYCLAILKDGTFIGIIGLTFAEDDMPELGYWLGEPFWGNGYATGAASAVVEAARAAGAPALRSRALKDNAGSRNVLRKLGFIETHEAVDTIGHAAGKAAVYMHLDLPR